MAPEREPERTCVGCRAKEPKRALVRIVRGPDGMVAADGGGRAPGRGAYVHREGACMDAALAKGALWRALRARADPDAAARLRRAIEGDVPVEGS